MAEGQWTGRHGRAAGNHHARPQWNDEPARKTYVAILELLTPPPPKPGAGADGKSAGGIELTGKAAAQEDPQAALLSELSAQAQHDAELNGPGRAPTAQAVSRCSASWYLVAVFSITSRGRCGAGGVLSQGLPLTCAPAPASRAGTACRSWAGSRLRIRGQRPEARRVGRQHLVHQRQRAVFVQPELELGVGDDDAAGQRIGGGRGVQAHGHVAHLRGRSAADQRHRAARS
jgi:hypothetical protein